MKGTLVQDKYWILQTIGQDIFSETFLAKDKNLFFPRRYVIKKFRPILGNPKVQEIKLMFYQEASVLKRLSGENYQIPQLYEYFMDGEDFYLVREWIKGITLEQRVKRQGKLPETEVKEILSSILSVLKYIHSYDIVYRQLKPSSIILRRRNWLRQAPEEDYLPVPIYFGGVKELELHPKKLTQRSLVLANQKEYIPPEQEQGQSVYASDLYSLGLTAIYLLTGKTPAELPLDSYTNQILWHQEAPDLKTNVVRVINRAICANPQDRFTSAEEMLQALHSQPVIISESMIYQTQEKTFLSPEIKIISILFLLGLGVIGIFFASLNFDFDFTQENKDSTDNTTIINK